MLSACRRLLRDGGRTAFHVIIAGPRLSRAQGREAGRSGPPAVLARHDYPAMLRSAGFDDVEESDLTADYRKSVRALLKWSDGREHDLRAVLGDQFFEVRQPDRRLQLGGIDGGLVRRSMIVARAA